jgi:hypothetical protein
MCGIWMQAETAIDDAEDEKAGRGPMKPEVLYS